MRGGIEDARESTRSDMEMRLPLEVLSETWEAVAVARASDQTTLFVNRAFERLAGRPVEEMIGSSLLSIVPAGLPIRERLGDIQAELRRCGRWEGEIEERTADGTPSLARLRIVTYESAQHGPVWVASQLDITEYRQSEQALARRDAILEAIGRGVPRLLADEQLDDAIQAVLASLGQAIEASRSYIFENHLDADGRVVASQRYEWVAPGVTAEIDNPGLQNVFEEESKEWRDALDRGEAMQALVRDLPEAQRPILEEQDTLSIAELPIHVAGELWGFLGFDDCREERVWSPIVLDGAKVAAQALGAAIERRRVHALLSQSEARFRGAFENTSVGMAVGAGVTTGERRVVTANRALCEMLGYSEQEMIGKSLRELTHPDDREAQRQALDGLASGEIESYEAEKRYVHKRGHAVWVQLNLSAMRDATTDSLYAIGLVQDISERKRSQERLAYLAYHDELTDLPNRVMFGEQLEAALARARRHERTVAVLYVDLDRFNLVNDRFGEAAGDTVIREVAARLRRVVRAEEFVARTHGDEFLLLLSEPQWLSGPVASSRHSGAIPPSVSAAVKRVRQALRQPLVIDDQELALDASVGISVFPDDGDDAEALVQHANLALYEGERGGGSLSRIYSQRDPGAADELALRHRLHRAVQEREFVLHYQPIVTLGPVWEAAQAGAFSLAGHTSMVEALIRWEDPELGLVAPAEFIPLAEESGLIQPITGWVVEEICRQLGVWDEHGVDLTITFNLSGRELSQPNPMRHILGQIAALGADSERLVVELTETATVVDPTHAQTQFQEGRDGGLRVAIDDFGAGYSSLSRLMDMRPAFVKMDRSLSFGIPADARARAIVGGFIRIALELGIPPVFEGIETEEQWCFGVETGCTLGQGFQFSRPLPAEELTRELARSRRLD